MNLRSAERIQNVVYIEQWFQPEAGDIWQYLEIFLVIKTGVCVCM